MLRIILVTVLLASSAIATDFETCDDGGDAPISVSVTGCVGSPCKLTSGTNVTIELRFLVAGEVLALVDNVLVIVGGLTINYKLGDSNACELLTDCSCPLKDGITATLKTALKIPQVSFQLSFKIKFYLLNQLGVRLTCFQISGVVG